MKLDIAWYIDKKVQIELIEPCLACGILMSGTISEYFPKEENETQDEDEFLLENKNNSICFPVSAVKTIRLLVE